MIKRSFFFLLVAIGFSQSTFAMDLIEAAKSGDEQQVTQLLEQKANIDSIDSNEKIAIVYATENNHEHIVSLLVQAHAKNPKGAGYAFQWAVSENHTEIVKQFIKAGPHIDSLNCVLLLAIIGRNLPISTLLIAAQANVNELCPGVNPPLAIAAAKGSPEIVCLLIQAGADLYHKRFYENSSCKMRNTALEEAAEIKDLPMCELLVEKMLCILSEHQKQRIRTFFKCLQRNFNRGSYCNLRDVFKKPLCEMIREENALNAQRAINSLAECDIKKRLLQKYFPKQKKDSLWFGA